MYESFFGMKNTPFSRNVPADALYEPPAVAETLGRLRYAADRQLFAVVTADAGCGKSTLIRKFAESLPPDRYIFMYLSDSKLTPRWLYKGMLDQLGMESRFYRGDSKRQMQKQVEIIRTLVLAGNSFFPILALFRRFWTIKIENLSFTCLFLG